MSQNKHSKSVSSPTGTIRSKYLLSKDTPEERKMLTRALQRPYNPETKPVAKLLSDANPKFLWVNGFVYWSSIQPGVIVNRIPSSGTYFSKTQLSLALKEQMPFLYQKGEVAVNTPRTYEVNNPGDLKAFCKQFRINACLCILKKVASLPKDKITIPDGTVPLDCADFAVKRVIEYLQYMKHEDLDEWSFSVINEEEWNAFLYRFYDIAHYDAKFLTNDAINVAKLQAACKRLLDIVYKEFPFMKHEGKKNLWICKPSNGSCGRGVKVFRKLEEIVGYCKPNYYYVIQKYIEEPLLIYKTKFDIRQWFLITSVSPLIIWMYDECYLRFCSQEFSLNNLHESVHLCNNSVQWKYKNGERSPKLPKNNMWDSYVFADYLRTQQNNDQWTSIQDQMRQAIIAACLVSQEKMHPRPNSFHLYGADFMVTADYKVWLIEMNSHPSMQYSTSVTARMCKSVLEDTIRVGVERRLDPSVKVRRFKEIYNKARVPKGIPTPECTLNSRQVKIFNPQKNKAKKKSFSNTSKKFITYEEIATYKNNEKCRSKEIVKTQTPLDPGDIHLSQELGENKNSDKPKLPTNQTNQENEFLGKQQNILNENEPVKIVEPVPSSDEKEKNESKTSQSLKIVKKPINETKNEALENKEEKVTKQKSNDIKKKSQLIDPNEKLNFEIIPSLYEKILESALKNSLTIEDILFPMDKNKLNSDTPKNYQRRKPAKTLQKAKNSKSTQTINNDEIREKTTELLYHQPEVLEISVMNCQRNDFETDLDESEISICSDSECSIYTEANDSTKQAILA